MKEQFKINQQTLGGYYVEAVENAHSTRNFAIAEFVDNSIESYERMHNDSCKGCKIQIEFSDDPNYHDSHRHQNITITDNAAGFNDNVKSIEDNVSLFGVREYHNVRNKNEKGNHNYGFKFASFYLGKGFEINSKKENGHEIFFSIVVTEKNKDIPINDFRGDLDHNPEVKLLDNQSSGSVIKIVDINTNKFFEKEEINSLIEFLEYRYQKAIASGCEIRVKSNNIDAKVPKIEYEWFNINTIVDKNKNGCLLQVSEELVENLKKYMYENIFTSAIDLPKERKFFKHEAKPWNKIFDKNGLCFEYEKDLENNNSIHITWGLLSDEYIITNRYSKKNTPLIFSNLNGVITEIAGRAINHPLRLPNEQLTGPLDFVKLKNGKYTMSRFLIIANFDDARDYVVPEQNKKGIHWNNESDKATFLRTCQDIYETCRKYFDEQLEKIINLLHNPSELNVSNKRGKAFVADNTEKINYEEDAVNESVNNFPNEERTKNNNIPDNNIENNNISDNNIISNVEQPSLENVNNIKTKIIKQINSLNITDEKLERIKKILEE